jgi:hypothetical protein
MNTFLIVAALAVGTADAASTDKTEETKVETTTETATTTETTTETKVEEGTSDSTMTTESSTTEQVDTTEAKADDATATEVAPAVETTTTTTTSASSTTVEGDMGVSADAGATLTPGAIKRGTWYLGFGFGVGSSNVSRKAIGGSLGATFNLRSGAIINDIYMVGLNVMLLGQYNKWEESRPAGAALSSVMGEFMYFPMAHKPFNVAAGLGWGSAVRVERLSDSRSNNPNLTAISANGVSWMLGAGWDLFAGEGFNLGFQGRYDGVNTSELGTNGTYTANLWMNWY